MGNEAEELEELVKKIKAKDLNAEAKKRGIKTHCVKKLDIAKQLPREVVEELSAKSQ
jgi:Zn-dependent M32 family carboxypeptidase